MATEKDDIDDLVDYDEEEEVVTDSKVAEEASKKGHYVGIHASGFKDFLLKPALLRAIVDAAFEHPSQVQDKCIPSALLGMDILCQAKAGMGKTAVFVLATLHQLEPEDNTISVVAVVHTREVATQICIEYQRFSKYMEGVKTAVFFGGIPRQKHENILKNDCPHIAVGCVGRVLDLVERGSMKLDNVKHFVVDECDSLLAEIDSRRKVQQIFKATPMSKQVMMFSATMDDDVRKTCRKFMNNPVEMLTDNDNELVLHGLLQYYLKVAENEKNRKLNELMDAIDFNQVIIFVSKVNRAHTLAKLLKECNFPCLAVTGKMTQPERTAAFKEFKDCKVRILVSTNLFGRGIDVERVNVVINYDFPSDTDSYIHRVGRAGRFGSKGLAISFVSSEDDAKQLEDVQAHFKVNIPVLPDELDSASYTA